MSARPPSIVLPILALAILLPGAAAAQQQDEQLWLQINTHVPVADRVRVTLEQIGRFGDRAGGLFQTEFGGIVGYRASDQIELGIGFRKVGAHNGNTADDEDRLRQHVVGTFGPFTTRFRIDERFHPRGGEIGFRIRPLVRYNHRFGRKGLAIFVSHESFILPNSTAWGQRRGYERMRNIVGVVVPFGKRVSADIGYLNQYRFAAGRSRAQMDHALTLQLTISLPGWAGAKLDD
ncbi:DUF2490 domain-containing protein [Sphingomonas sp. NBWT7]|uniref:DUF2490 domain-containing protein n=1 Tax=Sphingomonas sp. NBWT7 TaxID=2596913 RepID=UPI0016251318|nr:DUF2490 domain-containing protein [Sphingomonas sp. NBWT7]QNE32212.1 DUF2490 domain-containing protein [Sphingomonas sp. NBWT7]